MQFIFTVLRTFAAAVNSCNQSFIFILIDSAYSLFLDLFLVLKKQTVEQIAANAAKIRRANVVLSPSSASSIESSIPRKLTMLSEGGGALVPVEKALRSSCLLSEHISNTWPKLAWGPQFGHLWHQTVNIMIEFNTILCFYVVLFQK